MNTPMDNARADRLYALLPTVHRIRDADQGYRLKALLRVIAEQANVVEDDIAQLYDNWFIETAQDWAVLYIGDLVGHVPLAEAGLPADAPACENPRVLVPRREVANTIRNRRAKGTLALLEQLAHDVAGWPARAVEFFKLLSRLQNINHLYPHRHRLVDLREMDALDRLGGGGEYERPMLAPAGPYKLYRVGEGDDYEFHRIADALAQWQKDQPDDAVIELGNSAVFVEPLSVTLADGQSLQLHAAQRTRPVLRLIDWQTNLPDALTITLGERSRISLDGLLVTGRPLRVRGRAAGYASADVCGARVVIRHCTLVPGWAIDCDCEPRRPAEPSLEISGLRAAVSVEHSIVGTIRVSEDAVGLDPIPLSISDSIVDATGHDMQAIGAPGDGIAHLLLTVSDTTVFGIVDVHAIELAENCIFTGCVNVARRQIGCVRFCYVPCRCRTPRRYRCQPDEAIAEVRRRITDADRLYAEILGEQLRLRPQFTSEHYGTPGYAQLGVHCAPEIVRGADDDSKMGVYHDLFQPQRAANLRARLAQFTPAGMHVGLLFAN
jgi:hypothetical protein